MAAWAIISPTSDSGFDLACLQTLLLGLIGLPPVNGVLPQAPMHTRSLAHLRRGEGAESGKRGEGAEAGGRGGRQLPAGRPTDLSAVNHEGCPELSQHPQQLQHLQQSSLAAPVVVPGAAQGPLLVDKNGLLLLLGEPVVQLEVGGVYLLWKTVVASPPAPKPTRPKPHSASCPTSSRPCTATMTLIIRCRSSG